MSAVLNGIGPVSARYAAQIRELLYVQAIKRLAAESEAARAEAEAERLEAVRASVPARKPVTVEVAMPAADLSEPVRQPEPMDPAPVAPAQIFNEHA